MTYGSTEELQSQITGYFKTYGAVSENRDAIKVNKQFQFGRVINECRTWSFTDPMVNNLYSKVHKTIGSILKAQAQAKKKAQGRPKL